MRNNRKVLTFLYRIAGKLKWNILFLLFVQTGSGICSVCIALFLRNIIDAAAAGSRNGLLKAVCGFIGLVCLQLCLKAFDRLLAEATRGRLENRLKVYLYERLLERTYGSVTAVHSGEWMNRLTNDTTVVANGLTDILPGAAGMLVRLAGAVIMISLLEPAFLYLILPAGGIMLLFSASFRNVMKRLHKKMQEADGNLRVFLQESLESLLIVHSYSAEKEMMDEAKNKMKAHQTARMERNLFSTLCNLGFGALMNFAYAAGAVLGGLGILAGTMSYGTFTAVLQLIGQAQAPFANLSGFVPRFYAMLASAERLLEADVCKEAETGRVRTLREVRKVYQNELEAFGIRNGTFTYDPPLLKPAGISSKAHMPVVLSGLDLVMKKGQYTAFIGPSGCGKSTVLKLLMCLYSLNRGECFLQLNGEQVKLDASWQRLFAYVPQGNYLMSGTIREIVSLADRERQSEEKEIWQALKTACADTFVSDLEQGIDTLLGEHGKGLSEGQMQRLAIARAVFSRRPILLLDECTSALDEATEKRLLKNIREMTDQTVLLVTHRPEAIHICDQIFRFSADGSEAECVTLQVKDIIEEDVL